MVATIRSLPYAALNALLLWFIRWRMSAYDRRKASKPDQRSAEADEYRKLYKTARWQRLRNAQLAMQPLCQMCLITEDVTAADIVDHVKPHRGDADRFFDASNLQSLCKYHHDSVKQRIERGSKIVMYGLDGYPVEFD